MRQVIEGDELVLSLESIGQLCVFNPAFGDSYRFSRQSPFDYAINGRLQKNGRHLDPIAIGCSAAKWRDL